MKPSFVLIVCLLLCSLVCITLLIAPDALFLQAQHTGWIAACRFLCPWVLLVLSLRAWHISRLWRRMLHARQPPVTLNRGQHRFDLPPKRGRCLERLCLLLVLLAVMSMMEVMV